MPLSGSSLAHDVLGKYAILHFLELCEESNGATGISDFRKSPPLAILHLKCIRIFYFL